MYFSRDFSTPIIEAPWSLWAQTSVQESQDAWLSEELAVAWPKVIPETVGFPKAGATARVVVKFPAADQAEPKPFVAWKR